MNAKKVKQSCDNIGKSPKSKIRAHWLLGIRKAQTAVIDRP